MHFINFIVQCDKTKTLRCNVTKMSNYKIHFDANKIYGNGMIFSFFELVKSGVKIEGKNGHFQLPSRA